ncbi:hypothetical protein [Endozoicomonas sp. YOMI1]|uniref:hypothetical protein n=1 Tax=Endozoicomonas sp. YOMI1 TaxID=2828739 RepID=UPI002148706B|nr:hypothetical protein [Endozoicomonas sp. YOMI1]
MFALLDGLKVEEVNRRILLQSSSAEATERRTIGSSLAVVDFESTTSSESGINDGVPEHASENSLIIWPEKDVPIFFPVPEDPCLSMSLTLLDGNDCGAKVSGSEAGVFVSTRTPYGTSLVDLSYQ